MKKGFKFSKQNLKKRIKTLKEKWDDINWKNKELKRRNNKQMKEIYQQGWRKRRELYGKSGGNISSLYQKIQISKSAPALFIFIVKIFKYEIYSQR